MQSSTKSRRTGSQQTLPSAIMPSHVGLPQDVWTLVLQHVPLTHRLRSCALVCQEFKAAAVAATQRIETSLCKQPAVDNFVAYLQQHGRHLTSLVCTVDGIGGTGSKWPKLRLPCQHLQLPQLPCQHLQQLRLASLDFGLGPDEDCPSVLDTSTAITHWRWRTSTSTCLPCPCCPACSTSPSFIVGLCSTVKTTRANRHLLSFPVCGS